MAIEGSATAVIAAPIERVYAVAADVAASPRWQPQFKDAEVLERDGDGNQTLVAMVTDGKVRDLRSEVRFTYDPPVGLRWRQLEGDLKSVEGSWTFADLGDGRTRATYALTVDLGRILGTVIRGPLVGLLRQQLVDTMPDKLKRDVEDRPDR
jgi:ribosome-associated toxin RatA of RatAB toxin-antitoxin module